MPWLWQTSNKKDALQDDPASKLCWWSPPSTPHFSAPGTPPNTYLGHPPFNKNLLFLHVTDIVHLIWPALVWCRYLPIHFIVELLKHWFPSSSGTPETNGLFYEIGVVSILHLRLLVLSPWATGKQLQNSLDQKCSCCFSAFSIFDIGPDSYPTAASSCFLTRCLYNETN